MNSTPTSEQDKISPYNINIISSDDKKTIRIGGCKSWTNITRIVWQTVTRIANEILEVKWFQLCEGNSTLICGWGCCFHLMKFSMLLKHRIIKSILQLKCRKSKLYMWWVLNEKKLWIAESFCKYILRMEKNEFLRGLEGKAGKKIGSNYKNPWKYNYCFILLLNIYIYIFLSVRFLPSHLNISTEVRVCT